MADVEADAERPAARGRPRSARTSCSAVESRFGITSSARRTSHGSGQFRELPRCCAARRRAGCRRAGLLRIRHAQVHDDQGRLQPVGEADCSAHFLDRLRSGSLLAAGDRKRHAPHRRGERYSRDRRMDRMWIAARGRQRHSASLPRWPASRQIEVWRGWRRSLRPRSHGPRSPRGGPARAAGRGRGGSRFRTAACSHRLRVVGRTPQYRGRILNSEFGGRNSGFPDSELTPNSECFQNISPTRPESSSCRRANCGCRSSAIVTYRNVRGMYWM